MAVLRGSGHIQLCEGITMELSPIELADQVTKGTVEPGFYSGLNNKIYHMLPGLSSSAVKQGLVSLAHLKHYLNQPSDELMAGVGTVTHSLVLEPELAPKQYQDKLNGNSKEGKAQKAESEAQGITLVRPSDYHKARTIAQATLADPEVH